jgi:Cd2+/Zn2+-exporting ATPase
MANEHFNLSYTRSPLEQTVKFDLPKLLPDAECQNDARLRHLESALQNSAGVQRAHLECERQPAAVCLHYDPQILSSSEVERLADRAGEQIRRRFGSVRLCIQDMDCSDCAQVIEHSVGRMEGVLSVRVNYAAQAMRVEYDRHKIDRLAIERRVRSLGYILPLTGWRLWLQVNHALIISLAAGVFLLIGWLGERFLGLHPWIALGLYAAAALAGGWEVSQHAWQAIRQRHLDTDLLMLIAAGGAAILGQYAEGALLLFLFSLGHALEERALDQARAAVRALADLAPKTALVQRNGAEIELPVGQLQLDEQVVVRPGVRLPVDGVVVEGSSSVNQAPVTGESLPVDKERGEAVFAGSINGEGALLVKVTRLAKDSTLARVMKLVEEAQAQKSPTQQTLERFERRYVPLVLLATFAAIVIPPFFGMPLQTSLMRGLTLLVAASPCALALGAPAAILAGVAQAARNGVLVKGGAHLENLGRLKAIAFDKTGTITRGDLRVVAIEPLNGFDQEEMLRLAAALEMRSAHPLAQAVVQAAQARGVELPVSEQVEAVHGRGLRGMVEGREALAGSLAWLDGKTTIGQAAQQKAMSYELQGCSVVWLAVDGEAAGFLALADTLRDGVAASLAELKQVGVQHTILLTGDQPGAAAAIAAQAGLSDVRAGLLPEDKLAALRQLQDQYGLAAMVGDGVNDAPALAHAGLGIAMGGAGTDVALETADVVLMGDDLSRLPYAIRLGRATQAIIQQNLALALGVIALLSLASLTGWVSIGLAVLIHEGSTLVVAANALRLLRFRPGQELFS